jgi:hypothetical protein
MRPSDHIIEAVQALRAQAPQVDLHDRATFLANLSFVHQIITASEGLLADAITASTGDLRDYFVSHLAEETGHVEWLAEDIGASSLPLSRTAVQMAGSMYYMVKHVSPACLLGYMLVLECFPMPLEVVEELERLHGKQLLRTVRFHAEHDPDHGADLLAVIDRHYCPEILQSAIETARYINEFVQELHHGR